MKTILTKEILIEMIINNENVTNIDVSVITDMSFLFDECNQFNQDISGWDVSNVIDMRRVFSGCKEFNQDLSSWDTSSVKHMYGMFSKCEDFNFKNFKRKNNGEDKLVEESEIKNFEKKRLLEYLAMYKSNNSMKLKVLSFLKKEQIIKKLGLTVL